jgi:putative membrane protein
MGIVIHLILKKMKSFKTITFTAITGVFLMVLPMVSSAQETKLIDPEIASIAVTANQVDIDDATVAKATSKNVDVLKFAETIR